MVIKVVNISDLEVLCYPLPLLKGELSPPCGCTTLRATNTSTGIERCWPINDRRLFKVFVMLAVGVNNIDLCCAHNSVRLSLVYRRVERNRRVRLVYIICKGDSGHFQTRDGMDGGLESARKRVQLGVRLLQSFVAEKLWEHELTRRTFQLVEDSKTFEPSFDVHTSALSVEEAWNLDGEALWVHFAKELARSRPKDLPNTKWLAFMSFTRYSPPPDTLPTSHWDVMRFTRGHCALGGGGLALFGSGNLHTWADSLDTFVGCMTDPNTIDRSKLMDDSAFRGFYWSNYATGLGSVLHELGHTFDLTHTSEGIMCRGGDDLNLALCFPPPQSSGDLGCTICTGPQTRKIENFVPSPNTNRHLHQIQIETNFEVTPTLTFATLSPETSPQRVSHRIPSPATHHTNPLWPLFGRCSSIFHDGRATWARSTAVLLANHRWFLDDDECCASSEDSTVLRINRTMLLSDHGVRVIEFRALPGNRVLCHWEFLGPIPQHKVPLGSKNLRAMLPPEHVCVVMVAEDCRGALFKARVYIDQLGEA